MKKRVLVIGSGGREHAIVDALHRSPKVEKIYCAPGNAGIAAQAECVNISPEDVASLLEFAKSHVVDLTVVGPEAALAAGVADVFRENGLTIFGPSKSATRIESSKEFAKRLMMKYNIPTGSYEVFSDFDTALEYVKRGAMPAVIKYDGLAAGKGVVVATTLEQAEQALRDMLLDETFGKGRVIVEEFLEGPEFSFMAFVNGEKVYPLETAQDHKRAYEDDKGPNTGGMGAYSPVPFIDEKIIRESLEKILKPAAAALVAEGAPFTGVLYGGLILTVDGPKVIEFNARFGDPETEVVLPRLKSDIYDFFMAAVDGKDFEPEWSAETCLGIVLASRGYPGKYEKNGLIKDLGNIQGRAFHMGTKVDEAGELRASGGRVLMMVNRGKDVKDARDKVLEDICGLDIPTLFYRRDIGKGALLG